MERSRSGRIRLSRVTDRGLAAEVREGGSRLERVRGDTVSVFSFGAFGPESRAATADLVHAAIVAALEALGPTKQEAPEATETGRLGRWEAAGRLGCPLARGVKVEGSLWSYSS